MPAVVFTAGSRTLCARFTVDASGGWRDLALTWRTAGADVPVTRESLTEAEREDLDEALARACEREVVTWE